MSTYGDGSLYLRGTTWWMKFYRDGRAIQMSCKTESEDLARRKLKQEMRKRDDEILEPRHQRVSIGDLVKDFFQWLEAAGQDKTLKAYRALWENHLKAEFGVFKAARFGSADQHKYRAKRAREDAASASINRELALLRRAFRFGAESDPPTVRRVPKFHIVKEDNARRGFLNRAQMDALKQSAAKHSLGMRAVIEAAHMLGWRRGSLLNLRVRDANFESNTLRVERTKNGDAAEAPMTPALRLYVDALVIGKHPDDLLFGLSSGAFWQNWVAVRDDAGLPTTLFHDLRRTSARSKREAGMDTSIIMELHGWKTPAMFKRYGIVTTQDKAAALAKLEAYEAAVPNTATN